MTLEEAYEFFDFNIAVRSCRRIYSNLYVRGIKIFLKELWILRKTSMTLSHRYCHWRQRMKISQRRLKTNLLSRWMRIYQCLNKLKRNHEVLDIGCEKIWRQIMELQEFLDKVGEGCRRYMYLLMKKVMPICDDYIVALHFFDTWMEEG